MRTARIIPIALALCWLAGSVPSASGGDCEGRNHCERGGEVLRLPVLPNDARTWITLHETLVKPLPDGASIGDVLQAIRQASRGKDGTRPPLDIYLDPIRLMEEEITLDSKVELLSFGLERVSLETYLTFVDHLIHVKHRVRNGVVVLTYPPDDRPEFQTATVAEARTWLILHRVVPLKFPKETPLRDVLVAITLATAGKGHGGRCLAVVIHPSTLKLAEKTLDSVVTIDLERTPLCTSLSLVLRQLGLAFYVRDDGVVIVANTIESIDGDLRKNSDYYMDEFDVFDNFRVNSWGESLRMWEELWKEEFSPTQTEELPRSDGAGKAAKPGGFRSSRSATHRFK